MSKIAVIYDSKHGTTEKYAKWICDETGADLFKVEQCKGNELNDYKVIVYGGAIHAGGILGLTFLKKNIAKFADKTVLCFAVGLVIDNEENQKQCREINFVKKLADLPCYFFKGAYDPSVVKGMDKIIMRMVKNMVSGKNPSERSSSDDELLGAIEKGADFSDKKYIAPLVEKIKSL